ncbi:hypothetical protein [Pandoraea sp.]|uniref:hypothetical protein n=1 Tax=Pandoraea sp. TaxID=1883445 RepID=UPI0035B2A79F
MTLSWFDILFVVAILSGPYLWAAASVWILARSILRDSAGYAAMISFVPQSLIVGVLWFWLGNSLSDYEHSMMAFATGLAGVGAYTISRHSIERSGNSGFIHQWFAWPIFVVALAVASPHYQRQYRDMLRSQLIDASSQALRANDLVKLRATWAKMDDFERRDFFHTVLKHPLDATTWHRIPDAGIDPFYSPTVQSSPYASAENTGVGIAIAQHNLPAMMAFLSEVRPAPELDPRRNALLGQNPLPKLLDGLDAPKEGEKSRAAVEFLILRFPELLCARSVDIGASSRCDRRYGTLADEYVKTGNAPAVRLLLQHGDKLTPRLAAAAYALLGNTDELIRGLRVREYSLKAEVGDIELGEYIFRFSPISELKSISDSGLVHWREFDRKEPYGGSNALLTEALSRELSSIRNTERGLVAHIISAMISQNATVADEQIAHVFKLLYENGSKHAAAAVGPNISCDRLRAALKASDPAAYRDYWSSEVNSACSEREGI